MEVSFDHPALLWLLSLIPLFIAACAYNLKLKYRESLLFSNFEALEHITGPAAIPSHVLQIGLNLFIFSLLVIAASGTNIWYVGQVSETDLAIVIDTSASMSAKDIQPARIEAAKTVALTLVNELPASTKVAVISFAGTPFVEQPLTEDLSKVRSSIKDLKLKPEGGTDVASAIIAATNTLSSSSRSKAAILITDGVSTVGLPLRDGVDFAKSNHIVIHTIGIGTETGGGILGNQDENLTILDEATLISIANLTSGTYRKQGNEQQLLGAGILNTNFRNINIRLTPTVILVVIALILLEWTLSFTTFSRIP